MIRQSLHLRNALGSICVQRLCITPKFKLSASLGARQSSTISDAPPQPKRPSPYRLIPPHTFLAQFAPLHVAGWRLDVLPQISDVSTPDRRSVEEGTADLQDRRLVRLYEFETGKQGWKDLTQFMTGVLSNVAEQDHHPKISISPAQDYVPSVISPSSPQSGYVLELSTHTHTPLPVSPVKAGEEASREKMRPGVTMKDLRLAEAVEKIWEETVGSAV